MLALYGLLEQLAPGPVVTLNRAVALAMVEGPAAGSPSSTTSSRTSASPATTACTPCARTCSRWRATTEKARDSYLLASRLTTSIPEQDHLRRKAEAL